MEQQNKEYFPENRMRKFLFTTFIAFILCFVFGSKFMNYRLVGDYEKYNAQMCQAIYEIYVDKDFKIVSVGSPSANNWAAVVEYKFSDKEKSEQIEKELKDVVSANRWEKVLEEGATSLYKRDDLRLFLTDKGNNAWEVKVTVDGFDKKNFLEKLIFENKKE